MGWKGKLICSFGYLYITVFVVWPWIDLKHHQIFLERPGGVTTYLWLFVFGIVLALFLLVAVLCDFIRRPFPSKLQRVLAFVLLSMGAPGWFLYLYLYGSEPDRGRL